MAFLLKNHLRTPLVKQFLKVNCYSGQQLHLQSLKTTSAILSSHKPAQVNDSSQSATKKRKETLKMITLLQNDNMSVTALDDAKSLAKRRSLHLVKVQDMDGKTQRPVYKLLTSAEMLQSELSEIQESGKASAKADKKSEKSVSISTRIAQHDLAARLKNISKWLNKRHEVRVLIQTSSEQDQASSEKIVKAIEDTIKTPQVIGKITQKRIKGGIMKFSILPVMPEHIDKTDANTQ